jgi:hypothetical protein
MGVPVDACQVSFRRIHSPQDSNKYTSLPSFIRLVQCIRRYLDSGQYLHLVNVSVHPLRVNWILKFGQGGKYGSSVLYYALYFNWRNAGG